jgi:hypothetical protein
MALFYHISAPWGLETTGTTGKNNLRRLLTYMRLFRQNDVGDIPQRLAAVRNVISRLRKRWMISPKHGGRSSFGRPNFTPRAFAAGNPFALAHLDVLAPASDWERRHLGGAWKGSGPSVAHNSPRCTRHFLSSWFIKHLLVAQKSPSRGS